MESEQPLVSADHAVEKAPSHDVATPAQDPENTINLDASQPHPEPKPIRGVTAVIYDTMHVPFFLIMKRQLGWEGWEFVKGRVEEGEDPDKAVQREIVEETGLKQCKSFKKLDLVKEFVDSDGIKHVHDVYLVEANMNIPIDLPKTGDAEHSSYLWGDADKALPRLTWDNDKKILEQVLEILKAVQE